MLQSCIPDSVKTVGGNKDGFMVKEVSFSLTLSVSVTGWQEADAS